MGISKFDPHYPIIPYSLLSSAPTDSPSGTHILSFILSLDLSVLSQARLSHNLLYRFIIYL